MPFLPSRHLLPLSFYSPHVPSLTPCSLLCMPTGPTPTGTAQTSAVAAVVTSDGCRCFLLAPPLPPAQSLETLPRARMRISRQGDASGGRQGSRQSGRRGPRSEEVHRQQACLERRSPNNASGPFFAFSAARSGIRLILSPPIHIEQITFFSHCARITFGIHSHCNWLPILPRCHLAANAVLFCQPPPSMPVTRCKEGSGAWQWQRQAPAHLVSQQAGLACCRGAGLRYSRGKHSPSHRPVSGWAELEQCQSSK